MPQAEADMMLTGRTKTKLINIHLMFAHSEKWLKNSIVVCVCVIDRVLSHVLCVFHYGCVYAAFLLMYACLAFSLKLITDMCP